MSITERTTSERLIDQMETWSAHNYHPLPVVIAEAEGAWVTDVDGRRYLDMLAAYSALNFGHRHPELIAAAKEQLDRLTLTSRAFHNDQFGPFCEEITALCGQDLVLPMNTGAEAVDLLRRGIELVEGARELLHRPVLPERRRLALGEGEVDLGLLDEVEEQVQRAFEGLEEHLQRVGRDIQILRQLRQRLTIDLWYALNRCVGRRERHHRLRRGGVHNSAHAALQRAARQPANLHSKYLFLFNIFINPHLDPPRKRQA